MPYRNKTKMTLFEISRTAILNTNRPSLLPIIWGIWYQVWTFSLQKYITKLYVHVVRIHQLPELFQCNPQKPSETFSLKYLAQARKLKSYYYFSILWLYLDCFLPNTKNLKYSQLFSNPNCSLFNFASTITEISHISLHSQDRGQNGETRTDFYSSKQAKNLGLKY